MHRSCVFAALIALMALTRTGHFGTTVSLPDASLAVFLLGGLWLGRWIYFPAFMALAFGIDVYLAASATAAGGCLTPAYWGLLPTYALMWEAGRWLSRAPARMQVERYAVVGLLATTLAFVVSNLTFWAFSGYFREMAITAYALAVVRYLPPYLGSTALYLALGWVAHRLNRPARGQRLKAYHTPAPSRRSSPPCLRWRRMAARSPLPSTVQK